MGICGFDEKWTGKNLKGRTVGALGSEINSCAHAINCCILKGDRSAENIAKICIDQGYTGFRKNGFYTKGAKTPIEGMANRVLEHIDWINKKDKHPTHNFLLTLQKIHNPETVECLLKAVCAETKGMIGKGESNIGDQKSTEVFLPDWPFVKSAVDKIPHKSPTRNEILDQVEKDALAAHRVLKKNWREITNENIPRWLAVQQA